MSPQSRCPGNRGRLTTLTSILGYVEQRIATGDNVGDNGVLGYGLVRAGLYRFRGNPADLEARIATEQVKPESDQGPLTAARDVRRTFLFLGFIRRTIASWIVTDRGKRILAASRGEIDAEVARTEWIAAICNLKFRAATDDPNVHDGARVRPLRIMFEMLATTSQPALNLALAFGATDETQASLNLVNGLVNSLATGALGWDAALSAVGATKSQAKNNVKILPSLAEQLELISRNPGATLTELGYAALDRMRASKPIWAADLGTNPQDILAASALLARLLIENVPKDDAATIVEPTGVALDHVLALLAAAGMAVAIENDILQLQTETSFDPYQDVPDSVFNSAPYGEVLSRVSGYVTVSALAAPAPGAAARLTPRRAARIRPFVSASDEEDEAKQMEVAPAFTYEELLARRNQANVARERRVTRHSALVSRVADYYKANFEVTPLVTQLYDLFLLPGADLFVAHEMKTITPQDERDRVREAVGQLLYYGFFERPSIVRGEVDTINIVAVDRPLTDSQHAQFLAQLGIGLIWWDGTILHFEGAAQSLLTRLPVP